MKRFIPLLVLCALALGSVQALAQGPSVYVRERVNFRTSTVSGVGLAGEFDSSTVTNTGTAGTFHADTTAPIRLFQPPPIGRNQSAAGAVDSAFWYRVDFVPNGTDITVSADSLYLFQEVSQDGVNWQSVTPTQTFYPANEMPTAVASTGPAIVLQEAGSDNGFYHQHVWVWAALGKANMVGENATTAPTGLQLAGYAFTRYIVVGDWGGRYAFFVTGPRGLVEGKIYRD